MFNESSYGRKINKGDVIGEIAPLSISYDPREANTSLSYYEDNSEVTSLLAFIHFDDRIDNSSVLDMEEKSMLKSDMENFGVSQVPMTDYIEANDRSRCEFENVPTNPVEVDPISKVDLSHLDYETQKEIRKILRKNAQCLAKHSLDVGRVPEHILSASIKLKDEEGQFRVQKFFPLQPSIKKEIQKIIDKYLEIGILEYSQEPARMISNLLAVKKKDNSLRLLCDLRILNSISQKLTSPFIQIPQIAQLLQNHPFRSSFDLSNSFFQITVDPSSRPLLCFRDTNNRILRYKAMPQGLTISPYYLSQLASIISENIPNTLSYVDDFLFAEISLEKHHLLLDRLLRRLCELNVKIRPDKLQILREDIDFLGFTFKPGVITVPELKVKTFMDQPAPKSAKRAKSMVAAYNYFRNFIPDYSFSTFQMRQSYRDPKKFQWTDECEQEFKDFKKILSAKIKLQYVDFEKDFICYVDASTVSIAFSIFQLNHETNEEAPLTFCAKSLSKHEAFYSANKLETLSLVWGLVATDVYLRFATTKILVKSDCRALLYLKAIKSLCAHMHRLSEKLNQYQIHIQHIPGDENSLADFYSRLGINRPTKRSASNVKYLSKEDSDYIIERLTLPRGFTFTPSQLREMFSDAPPKLFTKGTVPPSAKRSRNVSVVPSNTLPNKKLNLPISYRMRHTNNSDQSSSNSSVNFSVSSDVLDCTDFLTNFKTLRGKNSELICNVVNTFQMPEDNLPKFELIEQEVFSDIGKRVCQIFAPLIEEFDQSRGYQVLFSANAVIQVHKPSSPSDSVLSKSERKEEIAKLVFEHDPEMDDFKSVATLNRNRAISRSDLLHSQPLDPYCVSLMDKINQNDKHYKKFAFDSYGVLIFNTSRLRTKCYKPVLPKILLDTLVHQVHFGMLGMHCSMAKVISIITRHFHYPKLAEAVKSLLSNCYPCFYGKAIPREKLILQENLRAEYPLHVLATDYAGNFVEDALKNIKLLMFLDEYSGFIIAHPCSDRNEDTFQKYFMMILQHLGIPLYLRSDCEKSFASAKLKKLYDKYNITHIQTSPFNSQSNSRCEGVTKKLKEAVRTNLQKYPAEMWSSVILDICLCLNSLPQANGASATELFYGKSSLILYEDNKLFPESDSEKAFMEKLEAFRNFHTGIRTKESKRVREITNNNRKEREFKVKDIVYVETSTLGRNDCQRVRRDGPYIITRIPHPHHAQLQSVFLPGGKEKVAHFRHLIHDPKKKNKEKESENEVLLVETARCSSFDSNHSNFAKMRIDGIVSDVERQSLYSKCDRKSC